MIRWKDEKVERWPPKAIMTYGDLARGRIPKDSPELLADALDIAVAALRHYAESAEYPIVAQAALRKLGVEP